ncbi:MAG: DNA-binding protein [Chloroflexi bacterium HGW-Chloroflexi-8]|jgi:hypothetical protein|nr:MAG: DNA-binding protein [Chloroflexi bacterium HGW-Chloroflexi-8]
MKPGKNDIKKDKEESWPKGLSNPARRALSGEGITELHQLQNYKLSEIKKLHGLGPKGIRILSEALEKINLTFKSE